MVGSRGNRQRPRAGPGAAPLWGWKAGVQNGSPIGLGGWGYRVASLWGQAARAAEQHLLPPFFSFKGHSLCLAAVALTVRRGIFHTQQSAPPAAAPLLYLKGRGLRGGGDKNTLPTPGRAVSPGAQTQGSLSPLCSHPLSVGVGPARTGREGGNHT